MANFLSVASLILLAVTAKAFPPGARADNHGSSLSWSTCDLDGFDYDKVKVPIECANLDVPLDYTNPDSGETPLQLLRVNATKEPVLGSILFNPGGPGSSGVEDVAQKGHIYDEILGGQYDLIGFDPRGTGRTLPFVCGLNWTEAPSASKLERRNEVLHEDIARTFRSTGWDDSTFVAEGCYAANNETGRFLSTAFVVHDMVQIIDALGEDGMLRFWGQSYGTLLGQAFAAMYPERVDRMVLDSVLDGPDYAEGYWLPALKDTEKSLKAFFSSCISAGPSLCAIANFNGPNTTAADLLDAFNDALQALLDDPILAPPALAGSAWNPTPATTLYTALKAAVFASLYHASQYPALSATLLPVLNQNFTGLVDSIPPVPPTDPNNPPDLPYNIGKVDSFWGIGCTDSSFRASSPEEMEAVVFAQQSVSGMDDAFIGKTWPCAQWKFDAAERFPGPFGGKTNFPILFVNGEYDPATPIASAFKASAAFERSRVLTHGGQGHKFIRHPSICTAKAVKAYFINGTMPEGGTYCPADVEAFEVLGAGGEGPGSEKPLQRRAALDEGDRRLLSRMLQFGPLDADTSLF